ncbi:MAG: hypothetical protein HYR91_15185 [Flavobacteriia bacterium]|nr:hypothetical protein [Flavobacteriia bacterium]
MKKILIISYFYQPCNLTASQRVGGWAKYLSEYGFYPIIITRNWDQKINSPEDVLLDSGNELIHEKTNQQEIYYLPYKASQRDRIYSSNKGRKKIQKLSKLFTLKDLIFENYSNSVIPFSNIYNQARSLLKIDKSIELMIISGNPFIQFKFGYLLHQEFGIKWIADYRDDWNTSELNSNLSSFQKIISKIQTKSEKKWINTAECITSVSNVYASKISSFVNKPGYVILNGFDEININLNEKLNSNEYNITYNGSLYSTQPIEPFIKVIKKIIADNSISLKININFPGLAFDKIQKKRVEEAFKGHEKNIFITERISKKEVLEIQQKSDLLLMFSHLNIKGIPSSKLYEYIGLKKPILLFPNDHDIIEETLLFCKLGIICSNENDIYNYLYNDIIKKQNGLKKEINLDFDKIDFFSRKRQTAELAKLLNKILSHPHEHSKN